MWFVGFHLSFPSLRSIHFFSSFIAFGDLQFDGVLVLISIGDSAQDGNHRDMISRLDCKLQEDT
jgi:hypothetical protein